ncbi:MAG: FtsX-like permease family protein, partial [Planctomycetes bacterium]|nr:FtsX-like permease family protein [Planctomycetota bacterium]
LAFSNVRERRSEIGILRAIGFRAGQILAIFVSKAVVMGLLGGLVGIAAGLYTGITIGANVDQMQAGAVTLSNVADLRLAILAVVLAPFLCVVASWIPSMIAAGQDPADILQQE